MGLRSSWPRSASARLQQSGGTWARSIGLRHDGHRQADAQRLQGSRGVATCSRLLSAGCVLVALCDGDDVSSSDLRGMFFTLLTEQAVIVGTLNFMTMGLQKYAG